MQRGNDRLSRGHKTEQAGGGQRGDNTGGEQKRDRPKKESIINLSRFIDQQVRVKFQGGREATGKLKGYDHLLNLVLEGTTEYLRESEDTQKVSETTRNLGLVVCRGPAVTVVCPQDGHHPIENPFLSID